MRTAELYLPSSGGSCTLPQLPEDKEFHTVEQRGLLCGGYNNRDTCLQWSSDNGTWELSLNLDVGREDHVSWTPDPDIGTYLMGGGASLRTNTLIKSDLIQEPGFQLKHLT